MGPLLLGCCLFLIVSWLFFDASGGDSSSWASSSSIPICKLSCQSGGDERFDDYFDRLSQVTSRYKRVLMLGDSMGASAALLFSPLATAVQAFSPQVDLTASSIRPAIGTAEMTVLQQRLIQKVSESNADITVHVSSWEHDTDQGALLPKDKVSMQVYSFADHRLAFYLDEINQLELLLKNCMLIQQGFKPAPVALAI